MPSPLRVPKPDPRLWPTFDHGAEHVRARGRGVEARMLAACWGRTVARIDYGYLELAEDGAPPQMWCPVLNERLR
jgi:hypothetical protein